MNKNFIIIAIFIFIFSTLLVLFLDNSTQTRTLAIHGKSVSLSNKGTEIDNESNVNSVASTSQNSGLNIQNQQFDSNNNSNLQNNSYNINNQDINSVGNVNFNNSNNIGNQGMSTNNNINFNNSNNYGNNSLHPNNVDKTVRYKDIDWRKWESDFVNKILDDSLSISTLDTYPEGTWLYYSFYVYKDGSIDSIEVRSLVLEKADKQRVKNMIKGYEHQYITVFPRDSKRNRSKVSGFIVLANETKHSSPSDFSNYETVRE